MTTKPDAVQHVKFVQVSVAGVNNTSSTQADYVVAALDDKGRVWEQLAGHSWYLVPMPEDQK